MYVLPDPVTVLEEDEELTSTAIALVVAVLKLVEEVTSTAVALVVAVPDVDEELPSTAVALVVAVPDVDEELPSTAVALVAAVLETDEEFTSTTVALVVAVLVDTAVDAALPVVVALIAGKLDESSDANDEAALDRTLENCEASELDTAESVAVATTLDSSELREEARLKSALEAAAVTVDGTLVPLLASVEASESTEDPAEATTLEASDAAEDTRLERALMLVGDGVTATVVVDTALDPVDESCSGLDPRPVEAVDGVAELERRASLVADTRTP